MLSRMGPLPSIAGALSSVPLLPGKPRLRGIAGFAEALASFDFAGLQPRMPTRTFAGESAIEVGGRRVELIEVGPAHTPGDAIAWLPDARVCFSGDIVFSGVTPIMWTGPASNWIAALERIAALEPAAIVPGHGPVCDVERVRELIGYWTYLIRSVPEGAADAIVELTEELVLGVEYRTSPWGEWLATERTLINVALISRERDGIEEPLSVPARIGLISQMGALAARLKGR